jgi:hypothetical protein
MYPVVLQFKPGIVPPQQINDESRNTQPMGVRVEPILVGDQTLDSAFRNFAISYQIQTNTQGVRNGSKTPYQGPVVLPIRDRSLYRFAGSASQILLLSGPVGQSYRFTVLELPDEGLDPDSAGTGTGDPFPVATLVTTTETNVALNDDGTAPASGDGVDLTNAIAIQITVRSSDGVSTIDPTGAMRSWIEDAAPAFIPSPQLNEEMAFWAQNPQTQITFDAYPRLNVNGAIVPFGRVAMRPSLMALTGGGTTVDIDYTITYQNQSPTFATATEVGLNPATAATTQPPTLPTDGVSLEEAASARLIMTASGSTIESGGKQVNFLLVNGIWKKGSDLGYSFDFDISQNFTGSLKDAMGDFQISDFVATRAAWRPEGMNVPIEGGLLTNFYRVTKIPNPAGTTQGGITNSTRNVSATVPTKLGTGVTGDVTLRVTNLGPEPIYVGGAAVTVATGSPIVQNEHQDFTTGTGADLYAIASTADQVDPQNTRILEMKK